jgi:hypothetical protein
MIRVPNRAFLLKLWVWEADEGITHSTPSFA